MRSGSNSTPKAAALRPISRQIIPSTRAAFVLLRPQTESDMPPVSRANSQLSRAAQLGKFRAPAQKIFKLCDHFFFRHIVQFTAHVFRVLNENFRLARILTDLIQ